MIYLVIDCLQSDSILEIAITENLLTRIALIFCMTWVIGGRLRYVNALVYRLYNFAVTVDLF